MCVGAYGGVTRKTFGALGDEVNLAARLMTHAKVGQILISGHIHQAVMTDFATELQPPLSVKGKAKPITVFRLIEEQQKRAIRLQEPNYALPMVGRESELQLLEATIDLAKQGHGQVVSVVAEAGLGKSRLVAEVIRSARKVGFVGYGGACQSDAIHTPYQAWKSIWGAFFGVDPDLNLNEQMRLLQREIGDRAPGRVNSMPLLNIVLGLEMPENDFTRTLEPKYRKSALQALLEECLRAAAVDEPLLIVIEDLHWIDALSHDLLEELARGLSDSRICFVLAYRPPQLARLESPRIEALPNFTKIELHELNRAEAEIAIRAKLAQLYPARGGALPSGLVDKLMARAQGNPFYLEELLNYVRDRGLGPADIENVELPDSLHALILSRIDQLSEQEKTTLKVASIVGRLFRAGWLTGYYPELGVLPQVKAALDALEALEITPLDSPEPDLAYLFKHIVTHEVTYESLPFGTRAKLHEQLAKYLEGIRAAADTIAFHYGRSDNTAKKREFYRKAADAAHAVSAYETASEYLMRLLDLTPASDPGRSALALGLADTCYRLGDYPAARAAIVQAQAAATNDADRAAALAILGEVTSAGLGDYAEAGTILDRAVPLARASGDRLTLCRALSALGFNHGALGKLEDAKVAQEESLALARALGDLPRELSALNRLGLVVGQQGDLDEEERLMREVHTRAMVAGMRDRAQAALINLGVVADQRNDYAAAREFTQQALVLAREIGAQQFIALSLINLADGDIKLGQLAAARASLREGLALALRLGSLAWAVAAVIYFARLAHAEGQTERALALLGLARKHPAWSSDHQRDLDGPWFANWALDPSIAEAGMKEGEALDWAATLRELLK
jgi:predicted ATPase